jgi:hypothetical protein
MEDFVRDKEKARIQWKTWRRDEDISKMELEKN